MDWPAKSLDMNPIQHAWDMFQVCVAARNPPPGTVAELEGVLIEEWSNITLVELQKLIRSFNSCCRAVITA